MRSGQTLQVFWDVPQVVVMVVVGPTHGTLAARGDGGVVKTTAGFLSVPRERAGLHKVTAAP